MGRTEKLRYSDLTGREKRDYLFEQGIQTTAYGQGNNGERTDVVSGILQFSKSALESIANHLLSQSLTRSSDELEEPKRKLFHTYGTVTKIVFLPDASSPYTGLFRQKASGLARFSYAGPVSGVGVVPGLGLKFPLDGPHPSVDLVVMRKLDRQQPLTSFFATDSNNSVFQHPFTNILPLPSVVNLVMRAVNARFETVVQEGKGLHQSVEHVASRSTTGVPVAEDEMRSPYQLILQPTARARAASDPTIDFRDDLEKNIPSGTAIYEVVALDEPEAMDLVRRDTTLEDALMSHGHPIGIIQTESEFVASRYGDYRLFFKRDDRFIRDQFKPTSLHE